MLAPKAPPRRLISWLFQALFPRKRIRPLAARPLRQPTGATLLQSLPRRKPAAKRPRSLRGPLPHNRAAADPNAWLDMSDGKGLVNLDDYFTPKTGFNFDDPHSLPPLLLPSPGNIEALSTHAAANFRQLLADSGIPAAPSKITYGADGKAQFPSDYAYADQLKQARAGDPAMARELSTVNALTSHFVEMKKSLPFLQAYEAAGSQQEADAVVAKFSYLFNNQRPTSQIALQFSADGSLTVTADGKPYDEA